MDTPAAVLFDFDGVIVDSERLHHETMVEAMAGQGPATPWEFYREHLMGFDDRGAFAVLLERAGIDPTPEEVQRRIARKAELFAQHAAAAAYRRFPARRTWCGPVPRRGRWGCAAARCAATSIRSWPRWTSLTVFPKK